VGEGKHEQTNNIFNMIANKHRLVDLKRSKDGSQEIFCKTTKDGWRKQLMIRWTKLSSNHGPEMNVEQVQGTARGLPRGRNRLFEQIPS